MVAGNNDALRKKLFSQIHNEPVGGHCGVQVTMQKMSSICYWKGMRRMVNNGSENAMFAKDKNPILVLILT